MRFQERWYRSVCLRYGVLKVGRASRSAKSAASCPLRGAPARDAASLGERNRQSGASDVASNVLKNIQAPGQRALALSEVHYTLRTNQTMRAMMIIVPRMPPIYIRISVSTSCIPITARQRPSVGALPYIGLPNEIDHQLTTGR